MNNDLEITKLTDSVVGLYIASWNGGESISNLKNPAVSALRTELTTQFPNLGIEFDQSFINYITGRILCVNTPALLNKFFVDSTDSAEQDEKIKLRSAIRFTLVEMPKEFVNNELSLSSKYAIGEKLSVAYVGDEVYRDTNVKARSKMKSSSGGSGVGVWS